jgi:hypothetical protein
MKKITTCIVLFLFAAFFTNASAQYNTKTNNVEEQPKWKQAGQEYVEYYYLPDIDTYYYVPRKQFIYQSGGYWTFSTSLPEAHKSYDLYSANKVVINEAGAYRYFDQHKIKYGSSQTNTAVQKEQPANKHKQADTSTSEKKSG